MDEEGSESTSLNLGLFLQGGLRLALNLGHQDDSVLWTFR